jgi:hypothetical protein
MEREFFRELPFPAGAMPQILDSPQEAHALGPHFYTVRNTR